MENKKIKISGFILSEILLAGAILSISLASTVVIVGSCQSMLEDSEYGFEALLLARQQIVGAHDVPFNDLNNMKKNDEKIDNTFWLNFSVTYQNSYTADILVEVYWYEGQYKKHRIINDEVVDWKNADSGLDCDWLKNNNQNISASNFLPINVDTGNLITDISVDKNFAYISADATTTSLPDLYIVNIKDVNNPQIVGRLNTGPGISSIVKVGNYVFVANDGSFQIQVIDFTDPSHPFLVAQAKFSDVTISGGAGYGQSIAYFDKKIYVGLVKANGPEFHVVDVSNPVTPIALSSFEIGSTVNSISVEQGKVLLGTPGTESLILLDVSNDQNIKIINETSLSGWQTQGVSAVYMQGNEIYAGRSLGGFYSPNPELIYFDRDNLGKLISGYKTNMSVDDLFVYDDHAYLAGSDPTKAFQIFQNNFSSQIIDLVSTIVLSSRAVALSCNQNAIYVVTQNAQDFFHIFKSS